MKIKSAFFIIFTLFSGILYAADIKSELKAVSEQIKTEERELLKLKKDKTTTVKELSIISGKVTNYRKLIKLLASDIRNSRSELESIDYEIEKTRKSILSVKRDVSRSNIFVIDNLGYSYIKVISTAKKAEESVKTLEILSKANERLDEKITDYNIKTQQLEMLNIEKRDKISALEKNVNERRRALAELNAAEIKYKDTLMLLKHDEAGRREYLELLNFQRKELDDEIKRSARVVINSGSGGGAFARMKGSLPAPIKGVVIERYGEHVQAESGVTFFHKGVKITPGTSTDVMNPASGTVVFADEMKGFDNLVIVSHGSSYYTVYGNMSGLNVAQGDNVASGAVLGSIDVDRSINAPYLYFEIRRGEDALNPSEWVIGIR